MVDAAQTSEIKSGMPVVRSLQGSQHGSATLIELTPGPRGHSHNVPGQELPGKGGQQ
jgi:hypothetical protein